jgi:hypothetical protein
MVSMTDWEYSQLSKLANPLVNPEGFLVLIDRCAKEKHLLTRNNNATLK